MTVAGTIAGFSLPADTIKIGDSYIANPNLRVAFRNKDSNLLGIKIWENFSVILDLINYNLYLKQINIQ